MKENKWLRLLIYVTGLVLLEQVSKKEPSYADFVDRLVSSEVHARRSRYLLVSFRTLLFFIMMKKIGTRMST
jgi:hypothetical protein